jgi:hypothetical protein
MKIRSGIYGNRANNGGRAIAQTIATESGTDSEKR